MKKYMIAIFIMMAGMDAIAMQQQQQQQKADPVDEIFGGTNPEKAQEALEKAQNFVDNEQINKLLSYKGPSQEQEKESMYRDLTQGGGTFHNETSTAANKNNNKGAEDLDRTMVHKKLFEEKKEAVPVSSEQLRKEVEEKFLDELKTNKKAAGKLVTGFNVREINGDGGKTYKVAIPEKMEDAISSLAQEIEASRNRQAAINNELTQMPYNKSNVYNSYQENVREKTRLQGELETETKNLLEATHQLQNMNPEQTNQLWALRLKQERLAQINNVIEQALAIWNQFEGKGASLQQEVNQLEVSLQEKIKQKEAKEKELQEFIAQEKKKQDEAQA